MSLKVHLGRRPLGLFGFLSQNVTGVTWEHSKNGYQCDGRYSNRALHKRRSEGLSVESVCSVFQVLVLWTVLFCPTLRALSDVASVSSGL